MSQAMKGRKLLQEKIQNLIKIKKKKQNKNIIQKKSLLDFSISVRNRIQRIFDFIKKHNKKYLIKRKHFQILKLREKMKF